METDFLGRQLPRGASTERTRFDDAKLLSEIQQLQNESDSLQGHLRKFKETKNSKSLKTDPTTVKPLGQVTLQVQRTLRGHMAKIYAMQWSADSQSLVSASQDGKLIVWDPRGDHKLHLVPLISRWVMTCAYAPSGQMVACGGLENLCSIYQFTREGNSRLCRELGGHDAFISSIRFIDDAKILTASGDNTCALWDFETSARLMRFTGHTGGAMAVSVSPTDPNTFVSVACDASAKLWDVRCSSCLLTFPGHRAGVNAVDFLRSGQTFVTGSDDGTCRLFDIRADQELTVYENIQSGAEITSVGTSKSGRLLFVGDDSLNCCIWDVLHQERVGMLGEHTNRVQCLGVANDGNAVCTGSWDGLLRVWN